MSLVGRSGSTLWLLSHEMRLAWRGLSGKGGRRRVAVLSLVLVAMIGFAGIPLGLALRHISLTPEPLTVLIVDVALTLIFSLMLSQTLAAATQTLYTRGDLDLLFSSPLEPRKVLTVKFASVAVNAFTGFGMLLAPILAPVAVLGHPAWLAALGVLAALALIAASVGLILAMALFRLIGPERTRTVAQVMAALIGAGFFLTSQSVNILGVRASGGLWMKLVRLGASPDFHPPPIAALPLRAMLGEPVPLAILALGALAIFLAANSLLGRMFARDAAAAGGADTGSRKAAGPVRAFASGAFAATVRKELRLLRRDAGLMSQVLLRVLYLLPLAFVMLRNAGGSNALALPAGAAGLSFMAGQVAGSLVWITVSAEDAPDLLACAPTAVSTFMRAKLAAALTPLALLLAIPLAILTSLSPATGLAATLGCAGSAGASGLINIWYQKPGKRADFRRRRGSSWFATLAELIVTSLIAGAAGLAAALQIWALVPAALAALLLLALRRNDAQIAQALRAAT